MKEFKATIVDGTKRKHVTVMAQDKYEAAVTIRKSYYNEGGHSQAYVSNVREA